MKKRELKMALKRSGDALEIALETNGVLHNAIREKNKTIKRVCDKYHAANEEIEFVKTTNKIMYTWYEKHRIKTWKRNRTAQRLRKLRAENRRLHNDINEWRSLVMHQL